MNEVLTNLQHAKCNGHKPILEINTGNVKILEIHENTVKILLISGQAELSKIKGATEEDIVNIYNNPIFCITIPIGLITNVINNEKPEYKEIDIKY